MRRLLFAVMLTLVLAMGANAQTFRGAINGTVTDPSGAVVVNATVNIHNVVSGLDRATKTDTSGNFNFPNVPYNPYHMTVTAPGFASL